MLRNWCMALPLSLWSSTALAQDFFEMMEGEPERPAESAGQAINFSGAFTHRFHYALSDPADPFPFRRESTGPASVRYDLWLEARYRTNNNLTFQLGGLASYDAQLQDTSYVEMAQSYIEWGATPSLNIKAGRQLVSLGESNYFQIADRINPVDERAFGLAELREMLLPVAASRLSYYQSRWGIDFIALHEFRPNLYDEPHGDFDPYIEFRDMFPAIDEARPEVSFANPDIAVRMFWSQPWGDVAAFASHLHSRQARPVGLGSDALTLGYPEITLLGASANRVLGSWLLKSEYAYSDGELYYLRELNEAALQDGSLSAEGWAHQLMIGGRYSGVRNLTLDLELLGSRIGSPDGPLAEARTELQGVASIEYQMLNEDLVANLAYMRWAKNSASMVRVRLDYAFRDELVVFAGAVYYGANSDDAMLIPYRGNDRLFLGLTLSF